jgi:glucose-1-phosphate thymidylyltransferase
LKGVILGGGLGSRLYPLTHATNKHLLPIYDRPMVYYPIATLVNAGIDEVIIVTGGPHAGDYLRVLQNGRQLGLRHLEYTYQDREGGIAEALALCEDFADGESIVVILGDNTTDADIRPAVDNFNEGALIFLKEVHDPERYGCPVFDPSDRSRILRIEEKPKQPSSNFAVSGLYMYDGEVFDYIKRLKPSGRGELEITDVNNFYLNDGKLRWEELKGFWSDAGTFESLYRSNVFWAEKALGEQAAPSDAAQETVAQR